jgi:hypothetical protein
MSKPFSQACENNKAVILDHIRPVFGDGSLVLEVGTGTAQHVCFFAAALPAVQWQPSDVPANIPVVLAGLADCPLHNIAAPVALDVAQQPWPVGIVDGVFSANTLHIMSWAQVGAFLRGAGHSLRTGGRLCVYGPFRYHGEFSTPSNARFDAWLKERDPASGVRDFEAVNARAEAAGLKLLADHAMPANNQLLVWEKLPPAHAKGG